MFTKLRTSLEIDIATVAVVAIVVIKLVGSVKLADLIDELAKAEFKCITIWDKAYSRLKQIDILRFSSSR